MKCLACKNETMVESKATYFAHLQNCYVIIENVPCQKCTQCGEEIFPLSVMSRIDKIVASVANIASKVCIVEYKSVA